MSLLRKGSRGSAVTELQNMLRELDYNIAVTGLYDGPTIRAVRHFQSNHLDKHGAPLEIDGIVGELTWWALRHPRERISAGAIDYSLMPEVSEGGSRIGRMALQFAVDELRSGAGEEGGNNKGPWVKKYLLPTGLTEGNPWCAAFLSWCFLQAAGGNRKNMPFKYNASARNIHNQMKQRQFLYDNSTTEPQPGDIVTWWRVSLSSSFGHIGIVHHSKDGFLYTIEGNKAANVAGFSYVKTRMNKVLGFARPEA